MAFRAWNRGLAATTLGQGVSNAYGVWLYNGTEWYPDPTFPGSAACPGSTVLWAGKLDYWLIGSTNPQGNQPQTLCRFDGVNLVWDQLTLPAQTLSQLPINPSTGKREGGVTAAACYAWNNCWFAGTDGIQVHWDGQQLTDASSGAQGSPWLQGDFTSAVAGTTPSGQAFGLAVTDSGTGADGGTSTGEQLPLQPDGAPPPQVYGSQGDSFSPLAFSPPTMAEPGDPFTTDLTAVAANGNGQAWVAGEPAQREAVTHPPPGMLLALDDAGQSTVCPGYGGSTFASATDAYEWSGLSVFPDGSGLAGAIDTQTSTNLTQPAIVWARCGQAPVITRFVEPEPLDAEETDPPLIAADEYPNVGSDVAVAANASNDAWAATPSGTDQADEDILAKPTLRPHLYHWTDGQTPDAPAGDDDESRPSVFTIDPPTYVPTPPAVVIAVPPAKVKKKVGKQHVKKEKPSVYNVKSKLVKEANGSYTLYLSFKVRRPVTIGAEAFDRSKLVSSTGLKRFAGRSGVLALTLSRSEWPTRLKFVVPKPVKRRSH